MCVAKRIKDTKYSIFVHNSELYTYQDIIAANNIEE